MPRYVIQRPTRSQSHEKLVKKLSEELTKPREVLQPLVLEQEVSSTKSRHVHVIWDEWDAIPDEERSDVIVAAYVQAEGEPFAEQVTIALGVTPPEALALGLLPWKVVPGRGRHESGPTMKQHEKAMAAEARNSLLGTRSRELRYARLEDAEEARRRLEKALPGGRWHVVQEIQSDG